MRSEGTGGWGRRPTWPREVRLPLLSTTAWPKVFQSSRIDPRILYIAILSVSLDFVYSFLSYFLFVLFGQFWKFETP